MPITTPADPVKQIGNDSTATFEIDPKFTEPTPGSDGSSDNLEEQARDTDDIEEEDEDDLDDEFEDDDEEEFDDDDEDELEDDDEDEDDDDEDDDELSALRTSGPLGYNDGDAEKVRAKSSVNAVHTGSEDQDPDDDSGDIDPGITDDAFTDDDMDTDRVASLAFIQFHAGTNAIVQ